ncbi:MAG: hypothetical protein KF841_04080 [Phycisphaerae bacterium]|nr:hypothetical protein [Phycisphaerae bacterium]
MQILNFTNSYNAASPRRFALWIGVVVTLASAAVNVRSISNDNIPNVLIPISILREHNLELGEFRTLIEGYKDRVCYWAVQSASGIYSRYPVWTGVMAVPFFVPYAVFHPDSIAEADLLRIGRVASVFACGIFAAMFAATLRRFVPGSWAAGLTAVTVLGSTIQHQLGANLTNQTLPIVCVGAILWFVTRPTLSRRGACAAGMIAGLAIGARPAILFVALAPLGVFLTRRDLRRHLPHVALASALVPALTLWYQHAAFGNAFSTGYGDEADAGFTASLPNGLAGLIVSPTCGLLIYSPWLIFAVQAAVRLIRGRAPVQSDSAAADSIPRTELARWLAAGIILQWLFFSKWWAWNGALAFGGPRMLAEAIPLMTLLIAMNGIPAHRRWLVGLGLLAMIHFAVGSICYDAVAPSNPAKPDWNIRADFIALYIRQFGVIGLIKESAQGMAILGVTLISGGIMAGRLMR